MRLKWKCDGKCGTILVEGTDHFYLLKMSKKGSPEEGQLIRLCMDCMKSQVHKA